MEIKSIGKIISATPDLEISKTAEQPARAGGLSNVADVVEKAEDLQQQNLFAEDLKTFDPRERYTSVHLQQGRVQTDADFNENDATNLELEDGVVVAFESGDIRDSFVTGDLWNSADTPPKQQATSTDDSNSRKDPTEPYKP